MKDIFLVLRVKFINFYVFMINQGVPFFKCMICFILIFFGSIIYLGGNYLKENYFENKHFLSHYLFSIIIYNKMLFILP